MIEVKRSETDKKPISEITDKEILRQQLKLLAEHSKYCCNIQDLCSLTHAMVSLYGLLLEIS